MPMDTDRQIREVAQTLYGSSSSFSQHRPLLSHIQSLNLLASQDASAGWRRDGRMSSVRRFFCLYCTFDLLFTTLIWLLCVMITGSSIWEMWQTEVLGYSFHTSLIDVAGVAGIRFLILLITYAAFHLNHWTVVALTTSGSCVFLLAKVFLFDWVKTAQPVFQVFLILVSFSLCWSEAWFLDCKVLPSELQAREILASVEEEQPVIRGNRIGVPSDVNSIADYYSPRDSLNSSPIFGRKAYSHQISLSVQDEEYKRIAEENVNTSLSLFNSTGWRECRKGAQDGDIVEYLNSDKYGKVYLLTATVICPAEFLFNEFNNNIEEIHKWNPTILESKYIRKIDHEVDITYQVTAGGGGGAVKPRDFTNVRIGAKRGDRMMSCGVSIDYPGFPPTKKYTRGENKVGCWSMQTIATKPGELERCRFQWLMGCDLKGWIPASVLDIALPTAMTDFLGHLRSFIVKSRAEKKF